MRSAKLSIPFIALLVVLIGACGGESHPAAEGPELEPVRATVAAVERLEVPREVQVRGTVEAARLAAVSGRIMATVTDVRVHAGDRVEEGDLLLTIDPEASRGQLAQASGGLAQAEAALAMAEKNYERYRALAERDAASEMELDRMRTQWEQARAAVESARGAVRSADSMASDSRVMAPFSGRVARRLVDVGDLAAPGRPLVMIESDGARRLRVSVPESVVVESRLEVGQGLLVAVDARPELGRIQGSVVEMTPGANPMSHAYEVKISLPVTDLATGSAGRAWIRTGVRPAVVVPRGAVIEHGGLEVVVLRDDEGRTTTRMVTTGSTFDGRTEVLSGLSGSERVLVGLGSIPTAGTPVEEVAG